MSYSVSKYPKLNRDRTLYNYCSAKKIYFASTPSKIMLLEKKESCLSSKAIQLLKRKTVIIHSKTGMLLFSENR